MILPRVYFWYKVTEDEYDSDDLFKNIEEQPLNTTDYRLIEGLKIILSHRTKYERI